MSEKWYFMENGIRKGPLTRKQISTVIVQGQVQEKTWIWRSGMPDWMRAELVQEVQPALEKSRIAREKSGFAPAPYAGNTPNARPPSPAYTPESYPGPIPSSGVLDRSPRPWRRFWARSLDGAFEAAPFQIIFFMIMTLFALDYQDLASYFAGFLLAAFVMYFLNSLIVSWFGTTFGKWMLGLRVIRRSDGAHLSLPESLGRNAGVFVIGQGVGVMALLAWLFSFQRLVQRGQTYYDHIGGFDVVSTRISWGRFFGGFLIIAFSVGVAVLIDLSMPSPLPY